MSSRTRKSSGGSRQPASGGPPVSKATQDLINSMMKDSKLTPFQKRQLQSSMKSGHALPKTVNPTSSKKTKQPKVATTPKKNTIQIDVRSYTGGKKPQHAIEQEMERPIYAPRESKYNSAVEKSQLQDVMAFGKETATAKQNLIQKYRNVPT